MEGVGDTQFVGGEGGGRAGGARVAEAGEGVGGGGAARRVTVVEQQHQGLEGPPVPREPEPERGQFPRPQPLPGFGQHACQGIDVVGRHEPLERGRRPRLLP